MFLPSDPWADNPQFRDPSLPKSSGCNRTTMMSLPGPPSCAIFSANPGWYRTRGCYPFLLDLIFSSSSNNLSPRGNEPSHVISLMYYTVKMNTAWQLGVAWMKAMCHLWVFTKNMTNDGSFQEMSSRYRCHIISGMYFYTFDLFISLSQQTKRMESEFQPTWQFWDSGGVKLESLCNFSIVGCQGTVNCLLGTWICCLKRPVSLLFI